MRNLVVCCDGTWATPGLLKDGVPVPTNVVRLCNALAEKDRAGHDQLKYYHPGVGTEGPLRRRLMGGAFGTDLGHSIMSAYAWLGINYREGDRIFLFGFSRGAYAARSLAGMLSHCGLLRLANVPGNVVWKRVNAAYQQGYRGRKHPGAWTRPAWYLLPPDDVRVHFLGVWDTVGALGIPNDWIFLNMFDDWKKYAFHDTQLSEKVIHGRHAVAMDEMRASYTPTLWIDKAKEPITLFKEGGRTVKQVWFPGVHCDVGGGYRETGLSDGALQWMMEEAEAKGLAFERALQKQVRPNPAGVLHDSLTFFFKVFKTQPRSVPPVVKGGTGLHASVLKRQATPPITQLPYHPTTTLPKKGRQKTLPVYASQLWNCTGIYLEAGTTYRFTASGNWLDATIKCGPGGAFTARFQPRMLAYPLGSLLGWIERGLNWLLDNPDGDLWFTKRVESLPWFCLVGVVANGGNPKPNGTPAPHEVFRIGKSCSHKVKRSGYLYCFANDASNRYGNNHGSVMLTVEHI